jgi:hypothetical protein
MDFPRPNNFQYKEVFYFDGEIAMMKGKYKDSSTESMGMRWMGSGNEMGYPTTHGNPMWMVVPDKLAYYMLEGIFRELEDQRKNILDFQEFMDALLYVRQLHKQIS